MPHRGTPRRERSRPGPAAQSQAPASDPGRGGRGSGRGGQHVPRLRSIDARDGSEMVVIGPVRHAPNVRTADAPARPSFLHWQRNSSGFEGCRGAGRCSPRAREVAPRAIRVPAGCVLVGVPPASERIWMTRVLLATAAAVTTLALAASAATGATPKADRHRRARLHDHPHASRQEGHPAEGRPLHVRHQRQVDVPQLRPRRPEGLREGLHQRPLQGHEDDHARAEEGHVQVLLRPAREHDVRPLHRHVDQTKRSRRAAFRVSRLRPGEALHQVASLGQPSRVSTREQSPGLDDAAPAFFLHPSEHRVRGKEQHR